MYITYVKRKKRYINKVFFYIAVGVVLLFFLFPIYWMVSFAFKTFEESFAVPPVIFFRPVLSTFQRAFERMPLHKYMLNSLIVSLSVATICIFSATLAGYSLVRFKYKGRGFFRMGILGSQLIPPIGVLVPLFILFHLLRLIGTYIGLILALATFLTPFSTWLVSGFIAGLSPEMEECAMIDGASRLGAILRITFPLLAPGIAAAWILTFIFAWNDFLFALSLTRETTKTLPAAIPGYKAYYGVDFGGFAAAGTVCAIPVLVFGLLVQRYFVKGLTQGAIKG